MIRGINVNIPSNVQCTICMRSKCTQKPFKDAESRAKEILEIVHTDVCGPMRNTSMSGAKYMLTFIDDKSRHAFVYFLKSKDEVFERFKEFKTMVERQTNKKLKILRSDNGTEFVNNRFDKYLKENGIVRQLTVPYTPQQNGVAERFNRTLIEMARSMIVDANVNECFWAEAVHTAVYLRNRAPTRALSIKTPYEEWHGVKPSVSHLRTFGSLAIALDKREHNKFKPRGKEYIMVGYSETSKAYRLYNKEMKKLIISRDVYFIESKKEIIKPSEKSQEKFKDISIVLISDKDPPTERTDVVSETDISSVGEEVSREQQFVEADGEEANEESSEEYVFEEEQFVEAQEEPLVETRRGSGRPRIIRTGQPGRPKKQYNMVNLLHINNPSTVHEALSSEYGEKWKDAMQNEYQSLLKNKTWELVELPKGKNVVGNKWVFTIKKDKNGELERFKARLVAKGYSQKYGVDYTETYSPVARYDTIRMIFAIAAEYELFIHQMDVTTAYLNSDLDEDIFMKQPESFVNKAFPNKVLKLKKALYGLKQSGRQWNSKLDGILKGIGFTQCKSETCVYVNHHDGRLNFVIIYVDDLLIASSNKREMLNIKRQIGKEVQVVDKGRVENFLSFEVERESETGSIAISQKRQISKLLEEYNMEQHRPVSIPLDPGHQVKCENKNCRKVDQTQYQSLIGSLMYLAISTRPDILHSVSKLAQRNSNPHSEHLAAAKRVLKYLGETQNQKLHFRKTGKPIECFVDADWGGDATDRKSYTGYIFFLAGAAFSYQSKKQSTIALSSTEAEYMALSLAVKEATYLKQLLGEMDISCPKAITINGDNISAMNLIKNPVYHSRSKHIEIRYHHVRDIYKAGEIELKYCNTTDMVADILTKNLPKPSHIKLAKSMGLY